MLCIDDLAEAYNCERKNRFGKLRRKSKGDLLSHAPAQPPVNAVDFQEAVIEDILNDEGSATILIWLAHY